MAPLPLQLSSHSSSPLFPSLVALLSATVQACCDSHHPSIKQNTFQLLKRKCHVYNYYIMNKIITTVLNSLYPVHPEVLYRHLDCGLTLTIYTVAEATACG